MVAGIGLLLLGVIDVLGAQDRFEFAPVFYSKSTPTNSVSKLQARLASGQLRWERERFTGYLRPLLGALKIGEDSQTLVFSKTSLQAKLISPLHPRALFFNDDTYVGFVTGSPTMEISVADPVLGAVFYTFDQNTRELKRQTASCLACHGSTRTDELPGHLLRSIYSNPDGQPFFRAGSYLTNHASPFKKRWGGWYVTGRHGVLRHMGNAVAEVDGEDDVVIDRNTHANRLRLEKQFNTMRYLSPHSDLVAMLVQDHQVHMHNLLSGACYHTRYAIHDQHIMDKILERDPNVLSASTLRRISSAGEKLLRYMLFTEETPLAGKVSGTTRFAEAFSKRGARDSRGRSLYQLDLKTRLLKYPCSYLIYSDAFDKLPPPMKGFLHHRLWEILSGKDKSPEFAILKPADRRAILEILIATKPNLPAYWKLQK